MEPEIVPGHQALAVWLGLSLLVTWIFGIVQKRRRGVK